MKKCPPVDRVSSIFSSALRKVSHHSHWKSATGMPLQAKIALRTMYVCPYCQDSDRPALWTNVPCKTGADLSVKWGMTAVFCLRAQSEERSRGNTRLYQEETIGILPAISASRQHAERSSSVQKDE